MNKITLPLSFLSLLISSQVLAVEHNLDAAGEVNKFVTQNVFPQETLIKKQSSTGEVNKFIAQNVSPQKMLMEKQSVDGLNEEANIESTITPICPTLATGSLYTLDSSQPGESICYHFEITERSKTTALLVGQSTETDVNLSIFRHNPDDTFTTIGASANAGNLDEVVLAPTEPGHYYWFMEVIESDGSPFDFGAAVVTNLDAYEFNDTEALATILPDKQNTITGNMDSINDIDYYQFTVVRGQDISIQLLDESLSGEFFFEINNNGWTPLVANNNYLLSGLQENQQINLRVRANTALPANPLNNYTLTIASIVASFSNDVISGESNVNRIPLSALRDPFLTTQAYHKLNWSLILKDSTGAPIEGALARFTFIKDVANQAETTTIYQGISDVNGQISEQINLNSCNANVSGIPHTEFSFGYKNVWVSDVEIGLWRLDIPTNNGAETIGIGGDNVSYVFFGHICDQDLISSNPS